MKIEQYIRNKRTRNGLTQGDVGRVLGYTAQFVANWERGASSPPPKTIKKIARLFSDDPRVVFGYYLNSLYDDIKRKARL
jgi:transcriptional regulator with XRE-family HTH domain